MTINRTTLLKSLFAVAAAASLPAIAGAGEFVVLDNKGDPHFNQLLGINNNRIMVGYFGDGTLVPNNGYVLVPSNHYSVENFTNLPAGDSASQTQAIGINSDDKSPKIVGFYTDNNTGFTHGFLDINGVQVTADDPRGLPPHVSAPSQNLLSANDAAQVAGFWVDNNGHARGFAADYDPATLKFTFTEVGPSHFPGAVSNQVSGITNSHMVCGFWTDGKQVSHGFTGPLGGPYTSFEASIEGMTVASTQVFGCNNNGSLVGQVADSSGNLHGFIYEAAKYQAYDAPGSSQTPVLGVQGTLLNGINDFGDVVGFFSNGSSKVKSFAKFAD